MIYGYCRVSTKGQERNGNSLDEQKREILCSYPGAQIVSEAYSGAKERPLFNGLVERLVRNDTLVVCKLDRFARSVSNGLSYIEQLQKRGVKIHILNMGLIEDTPMGRLIVTNLLAFAEFERSVIRERTMAGKEQKRLADPNFKVGRKQKNIPEDIMKRFQAGEITGVEAAKLSGISYMTWYRRTTEKSTVTD